MKDPFFPLSTRSAVPVAAVTNVAPSLITAKNFKENGRSGSDEGTLVIINGHSFAPGEKAFIQPLDSAGPKVGVTVLQIKEFSTKGGRRRRAAGNLPARKRPVRAGAGPFAGRRLLM